MHFPQPGLPTGRPPGLESTDWPGGWSQRGQNYTLPKGVYVPHLPGDDILAGAVLYYDQDTLETPPQDSTRGGSASGSDRLVLRNLGRAGEAMDLAWVPGNAPRIIPCDDDVPFWSNLTGVVNALTDFTGWGAPTDFMGELEYHITASGSSMTGSAYRAPTYVTVTSSNTSGTANLPMGGFRFRYGNRLQPSIDTGYTTYLTWEGLGQYSHAKIVTTARTATAGQIEYFVETPAGWVSKGTMTRYANSNDTVITGWFNAGDGGGSFLEQYGDVYVLNNNPASPNYGEVIFGVGPRFNKDYQWGQPNQRFVSYYAPGGGVFGPDYGTSWPNYHLPSRTMGGWTMAVGGQFVTSKTGGATGMNFPMDRGWTIAVYGALHGRNTNATDAITLSMTDDSQSTTSNGGLLIQQSYLNTSLAIDGNNTNSASIPNGKSGPMVTFYTYDPWSGPGVVSVHDNTGALLFTKNAFPNGKREPLALAGGSLSFSGGIGGRGFAMWDRPLNAGERDIVSEVLLPHPVNGPATYFTT